MSSRRLLFLPGLSLGLLACQNPHPAAMDEAPEAAVQEVAAVDVPAPERAYPAAGEDFYLHVNGAWLDSNPIPPEYSAWGVGYEINQRNQELLHDILEEQAAKVGQAGVDHIDDLLGRMYAHGMDEDAVEASGIEAIRGELDMIAGIGELADLPAVLAYLHNIGVDALFGLGPEADFSDSSQTITFLMQGGLGLPEKDYYLREDDDSVDLREAYLAHIARMFGLAGENADQAAAEAEAVVALETRLAQASYGAVEMRDTSKLANRISREEALALMPTFDWGTYEQVLGLAPQPVINVVNPGFFREMDAMLQELPLDTWKAYLRWQLLHRSAPFLSSDLVRENFDFFARRLNGQEQQQERWKRVLGSINGGMGEALGQAYVARAFSPEAKAAAKEMVQDLLDAYRERLAQVEWMSPETRAAALRKLDAFTVKIGYPDQWQDYSELQLGDGPWVRDVFATSAFESQVELARIGKPTDKSLWGMSPQTLNAYYNPLANEIVFPAAILQPPFFDPSQPMAANYGAMGAIIGHEITHGFDDMGSQFDPEGNLVNWWTEEDKAEFERRSQVLVDQFDAYVAIDDLHVNGKLTLGENIADLGGLKMAYLAFKHRLELAGPQSEVDGLSPEQQFFTAWAVAWRQNARPERIRMLVQVDPHSPNPFRANGPLGNLQAFADAFHLDESAPMMRPAAERAEIW